jgi:hypothetical protein
MFATPDDPPDGAVWPYVILAVVASSSGALAVRELRRRRAPTSSD